MVIFYQHYFIIYCNYYNYYCYYYISITCIVISVKTDNALHVIFVKSRKDDILNLERCYNFYYVFALLQIHKNCDSINFFL